MTSIEIEIPANIRNLNRSVSLAMRNGMGEVLTAKLTGHETTGSEVTFRGDDGVTSKGKVTAVKAPVTGSVWVTVESNLAAAQ